MLDQSKLRRLQEPLELDHSRLKRLQDNGTENNNGGSGEFEKQTLEQFMHRRKHSKRPQRGKRTQHLTLGSLNVNGTKALVDAAIGQECPSPKKKDQEVLMGAGGRGRIVAFNSSQESNSYLKDPGGARTAARTINSQNFHESKRRPASQQLM